jgi:large subunit ribosomal protein L17
MRHHRKTLKLGRTTAHRDAMLANQVCSLIEHRRIKTTLAKAKAARSLAEKMVTLGKKGTLHARRIAISYLRDKERVKKLFEQIAPAAAERQGGYTRIIKLGPRQSDSAPMALLEWVDEPALVSDAVTPAEITPEKKKAPKEEKPEVVKEVQETPLEEEVEEETTA